MTEIELSNAISDNAVSIVLVTVLGYIAWSLKKFFSIFEKNFTEHGLCITDLYNKHNKLAGLFNRLLGEHEARHGISFSRRVDDAEESKDSE